MKPKNARRMSNVTATGCLFVISYMEADAYYAGHKASLLDAGLLGGAGGYIGSANGYYSINALVEEGRNTRPNRLYYTFIPLLGCVAGAGARTLQKILFGV